MRSFRVLGDDYLVKLVANIWWSRCKSWQWKGRRWGWKGVSNESPPWVSASGLPRNECSIFGTICQVWEFPVSRILEWVGRQRSEKYTLLVTKWLEYKLKSLGNTSCCSGKCKHRSKCSDDPWPECVDCRFCKIVQHDHDDFPSHDYNFWLCKESK